MLNKQERVETPHGEANTEKTRESRNQFIWNEPFPGICSDPNRKEQENLFSWVGPTRRFF